jgi:hypothetical protein
MTLDDITVKYPEATILVDMARLAWNGDATPRKISFKVHEKLHAALAQLLGKDIKNAFITDNDVRHAKKQHGGNKEILRGQGSITPEDFAYLPLVLNEYDTMTHTRTTKAGKKKIEFTKILDGKVYVSAMDWGNSQIGVISLWKSARQDAPMPAQNVPPRA